MRNIRRYVTFWLLIIMVGLQIVCMPPTQRVVQQPEPKAAVFETGSLVVSPIPIIVGNTLIITANVTNVGEEIGTYKAALSIDGQVTESKDVSVAPRQSSTVEFKLNELTTGKHVIAIGESITSIDVLPKPTSIAFSCYHGDYYSWEICTMASDGTNSKNITNSTAMDLHPIWSPDGTKIAFESTREWHNRSSIYVMDADGNNVTCLTPEPKICRFPAWSPDGERIAYCLMKMSGEGSPDTIEGEEEIRPDTIVTMNVDGSAKTLLTKGYSPSWFPDSRRLAFIADRIDDWEIRSINIYGTEIKKHGVLPRARANYGLPLPSTEFPMLAVSPDGNSIALEYYDSIAGQKIYILKLDTGELTNLTGGLYGYSYCPAWSSDGDKIAFTLETIDDTSMYVIDTDGSNMTKLIENGYWPAWQR
jgi:Tol biopolymer transport system component/uncharacterized membrane protein